MIFVPVVTLAALAGVTAGADSDGLQRADHYAH
jgi:hypothetical protein